MKLNKFEYLHDHSHRSKFNSSLIEDNLLSMLDEKETAGSVKPRFHTPMRHTNFLNRKD